jgi:hypothetical protein
VFKYSIVIFRVQLSLPYSSLMPKHGKMRDRCLRDTTHTRWISIEQLNIIAFSLELSTLGFHTFLHVCPRVLHITSQTQQPAHVHHIIHSSPIVTPCHKTPKGFHMNLFFLFDHWLMATDLITDWWKQNKLLYLSLIDRHPFFLLLAFLDWWLHLILIYLVLQKGSIRTDRGPIKGWQGY